MPWYLEGFLLILNKWVVESVLALDELRECCLTSGNSDNESGDTVWELSFLYRGKRGPLDLRAAGGRIGDSSAALCPKLPKLFSTSIWILGSFRPWKTGLSTRKVLYKRATLTSPKN
jgi:hypothetical protein